MKQRILICTQTFPPRQGGMEAVMLSLAERFSLNGYDTLVATDKPYNEESSFSVITTNTPKLLRPLAKKLALNKKKFRPDITICDSWKSVGALPSNTGKIIVLAHGQELLVDRAKRKKAISALQRADLIISSSDMTKNLINDLGNYNVKTIYPTYMLKRPSLLPDIKNERNLNFLSLCRLDERKGLLQTASAISQLSKKNALFHWNIAGTGPLESELKQTIKELDIADSVSFHGRVDNKQKQELLLISDLFIMPSYQVEKSLEGFGISYIEAASMGIPSIAGNVGGAPEAVISGKTGWCVNGADANEILECLLQICAKPEVLTTRGNAARKRYNEELEGSKAFQKLETVISEL